MQPGRPAGRLMGVVGPQHISALPAFFFDPDRACAGVDTKVFFPGLASHPQHELARRQMRAFGGMVTIALKTDLAGTKRFLEHCRLFALAESLGGVESLIEHPALMTHGSIPALQRDALGIDDALVRLSVGIEDVEDLRRDLREALDAI